MENDRRRVRIEGEGGDNRGIAWQRETEIDWTGGGGWAYERGEGGGGGKRGKRSIHDVGSFTVVRHFGTCFPINMHVLVP